MSDWTDFHRRAKREATLWVVATVILFSSVGWMYLLSKLGLDPQSAMVPALGAPLGIGTGFLFAWGLSKLWR